MRSKIFRRSFLPKDNNGTSTERVLPVVDGGTKNEEFGHRVVLRKIFGPTIKDVRGDCLVVCTAHQILFWLSNSEGREGQDM